MLPRAQVAIRSRLLRLALLATALTCAATFSTHAQSIHSENFSYDSTYGISGHSLELVPIGQELRMNLYFNYNIDFAQLRDILNDSLDGYAYTDTIYMMRKECFRALDSLGLGLITGIVSHIGVEHQIYAIDHYLDIMGTKDTVPDNYVYNVDNRSAGSLIPAMRGDLLALQIARDTVHSPPQEAMMVDGGRYLNADATFLRDTTFYNDRGLSASNDSAHYLKISVSLQVKPSDLDDPGYPILDGDTLAYVTLFRRVDTLQSDATCRCDIYEPFDTVPITKLMYQQAAAGPINPVTQYPEVSFWLDMRRYDGGGWLNPDDGQHYHFRPNTYYPHSGPLYSAGHCDTLLQHLLDSNIVPAGSVSSGPATSEFFLRVTTTRKATVSFLRTRIAMHLLDVLERGSLDSILRRDLDTLFLSGDTILNRAQRVIRRFHVMDEPSKPEFASYAYLSRHMQRVLREIDPEKRGVFANPQSNFQAVRLQTGDLDTAQERVLHMMLDQDYKSVHGWVPVFYANPDSTSQEAMQTWWRVNDTTVSFYMKYGTKVHYLDTAGHPHDSTRTDSTLITGVLREKRVVLNTRSDYLSYLNKQQDLFGTASRWAKVDGTAHLSGYLIPRLIRDVNVARVRYRTSGDSIPVWHTIRVAGYSQEAKKGDAYGYQYKLWWLAPPHPEVIAAQVWLGLNCGVDGMFFQDMVWNGIDFGIVNAVSGDHSVEYGTYCGPYAFSATNPAAWTVPKQWIGMRSRFDMVKRIDNYLRDTILPVYEQLVRPGNQISVHDTEMHFREMPLVDTLIARLPQRYGYDSTGGYIDSSAFDRRDSTYIELTVYDPKQWGQVGGVSLGAERHAKYLLITNRRCYPDDTLHYDSIARSYGANAVGLGRMDARRPIIRLKNEVGGFFADSFLIQKVGDPTWERRVAVDALAELDWLAPGWGALYRVEPYPLGVSQHATAWNNAVHSENTARDTGTGTRLVVYERDSAIWMRAVTMNLTTPHPVWSGEWLVSDVDDTVIRGPGRFGHCMNPALATARDGHSLVVVWEQRNQSGVHNIRMVRYDTIPTDPASLPDTSRFTLTATGIPLPDSLNMTPAVVGLSGGYLIAWAQPKTANPPSGITLLALRDDPSAVTMIQPWDSVSVRSLSAPNIILDSVTRYPTLAALPRTQRFYSDQALLWSVSPAPIDTLSIPVPGNPVPLTIRTTKVLQAVHLAYQQGALNEAVKQKIIYHGVGVKFPPATDPPIISVMKPEDVNGDRPFCVYLHPSISCDSVRVGVAYETVEHSHVVTLRFRDGGFDSLNIWKVDTTKGPWQTKLYEWGEWRAVMNGLSTQATFLAKNYTRPSLVQFPACDSLPLITAFSPGMLSWQWDNDSTGRHNREYLYRYGQRKADTLLDGHDPSMLTAPYVNRIGGGARAQSGVLHRGPDSTRILRLSDEGDSVWGYSLALENAPQAPISLFSTTSGRGIVGFTSFIKPNPLFTDPACGFAHKWRVDIGIGDRHDHTGGPPTAKSVVGLPNEVLPPGGASATPISTVAEAMQVLKTESFIVGSDPVSFERMIVIGDSVISSWLNGQPYDTTLLRPADIGVVTELVRDTGNIVLWRSDTLWARVLGDTSIADEVSVPADSVAAAGTVAHIQLRVITTHNLEVTSNAGVLIAENLPDLLVAPKLARWKADAASPGSTMIAAEVHPNPVRKDRAELTVRVQEAGLTTVAVVDARGRSVMEPYQSEMTAGEHRLILDVKGLTAGSYTLLVWQGTHRTSTQVVVTP